MTQSLHLFTLYWLRLTLGIDFCGETDDILEGMEKNLNLINIRLVDREFMTDLYITLTGAKQLSDSSLSHPYYSKKRITLYSSSKDK